MANVRPHARLPTYTHTLHCRQALCSHPRTQARRARLGAAVDAHFIHRHSHATFPSQTRSSETLHPLTVHQIVSASESSGDGFVVDSKEVGQALLVGLVRKVDVKQSKIVYTIEDHTGTVEATHWINSGDDDAAPQPQSCREGMHARIVGNIKAFEGKRGLIVFNISPITDSNEITAHILSVMQIHLRSKGKTAAGGKSVAINAGAFGQAQTFSTADQGLSPNQAAVMKVIQSATDESGVSIHTVLAQLRAKFSEAQIRQAITFLSNEGHVYSTIDDDHFKCTDGG